jgi:hypothetical protein
VPTITTLLVIIVLSGNVPIRGAAVQCDGIYAYWNEDGSGVDLPLGTESRGAVIIETDLGTLRCKVWKDGFETWAGLVPALKVPMSKFTVQLKRHVTGGKP